MAGRPLIFSSAKETAFHDYTTGNGGFKPFMCRSQASNHQCGSQAEDTDFFEWITAFLKFPVKIHFLTVLPHIHNIFTFLSF
jgi:hypothetical protein